jgi:hypothetical protein
MNKVSELEKMFCVIAHISDHYAAEADAQPDWPHRTLIVTVDEGGRTIYAATLELDAAIEAKARLVRYELEQMIEECRLPILHKEVA